MSARNLVNSKIYLRERFLTGLLQWPLLILFVLGSISCSAKSGSSSNATPGGSPSASPIAQNSRPEAVAPKKVFETGEAVPAGYLGYKVLGSWYGDQAGKQPASSLLYVDLAIVNTDKKERAVGPMTLIDESGKEYALSEKAGATERSITQAGNVGSTQSKRATAIFEAPQGHEYRLKIQGFSDKDEVQIKLAPAAHPPSR